MSFMISAKKDSKPFFVAVSLVILSFALGTTIPNGIQVDKMLDISGELIEQAGTTYQAGLILDEVEASHLSPVQKARAKTQRCRLKWVQEGPFAAAVNTCDEADGITRARVLTAVGTPLAAARILDLYELPVDDIKRALYFWARGMVDIALESPEGAKATMGHAKLAVIEAVKKDLKKAEFLAIADYRLAQAETFAGDLEQARSHLLSAYSRQVDLDAKNPEFAEYRLFLVRILIAMHDPRAKSMAQDLLARDPSRYEYKAEVEASKSF